MILKLALLISYLFLETLGEKKKINIGETVNIVDEKGSQNETVLPKTSKYHSNCTAKNTEKSGSNFVLLLDCPFFHTFLKNV